MNKIFTFHGCDHKVGTSQLAECCAEKLAKDNPNLQILLVQADTGRGYEYCPRLGESFDRIRPFVAQSIIDVNDIKAKSKMSANLYIVGGNDNPQNLDMFTPDLAEIFLTAVRESFDIVIVDSGAEIVSGCTVGTLCSSDIVYFVLRQNESSLRRIEWLGELYQKLDINPDRLVINFYNRSSVYELDYIAERLCCDQKIFMTVRSCSKGDKSEIDNNCLMRLKPGLGFIRDINNITKDILCHAGIQ